MNGSKQHLPFQLEEYTWLWDNNIFYTWYIRFGSKNSINIFVSLYDLGLIWGDVVCYLICFFPYLKLRAPKHPISIRGDSGFLDYMSDADQHQCTPSQSKQNTVSCARDGHICMCLAMYKHCPYKRYSMRPKTSETFSSVIRSCDVSRQITPRTKLYIYIGVKVQPKHTYTTYGKDRLTQREKD